MLAPLKVISSGIGHGLQEMTDIAKYLDAVLHLVYTSAQQEFSCSYWAFRRGADTALVDPELQPIKIERREFLPIPNHRPRQ